MAQLESPQTPQSQFAPSQPKQLPLAVVMAIDLFLIICGIVISQFIILFAIVILKIIPPFGNPSDYEVLMQSFQTGNEADAIAFLGVGGIFATLLAQNLLFIGIPYLRLRWRKEPLGEFGFQMNVEPLRQLATRLGVPAEYQESLFQLPPFITLSLIGLGLGIVTLICNLLIGLVFLGLDMQQNQTAQYPLYQGDYLGQFIFYIGAGILAPMGEEVLFRGYIFNGIRRVLKNTTNAVIAGYVISALLFSLVHILSASENVIALLVPAFAIGVLFAVGMHLTKSIIPCIVAHAFNNSIALLGVIYLTNNPQAVPGS
jgi:membrane protease YdiL (CAAX protease family)